MKKIFISTSSFAKFDSAPVDKLKSSNLAFEFNPHGRTLTAEEVVTLVNESEGLIAGTEPLGSQILQKLTKLKVISRCGSGLGNVDLDMARQLGIRVFNTPDGPTLAVAELALGLMLALLRKIPLIDREMREGIWNKRMGNLLTGKTVGIIGFGKIGKKVSELLKPFKVKVIFYDKLVSESECDTDAKKSELKTVLKEADLLTIHLPHNEETKNMFGENELKLMKSGSFLVNCSRGGIVNEDALYEAIEQNIITGAAIDVFSQEPYKGKLRELNNVILTPHIGSYAQEARINMEIQTVENLLKGLSE
jgi:D-3-phosphoglycerate dehydrogenase